MAQFINWRNIVHIRKTVTDSEMLDGFDYGMFFFFFFQSDIQF